MQQRRFVIGKAIIEPTTQLFDPGQEYHDSDQVEKTVKRDQGVERIVDAEDAGDHVQHRFQHDERNRIGDHVEHDNCGRHTLLVSRSCERSEHGRNRRAEIGADRDGSRGLQRNCTGV